MATKIKRRANPQNEQLGFDLDAIPPILDPATPQPDEKPGKHKSNRPKQQELFFGLDPESTGNADDLSDDETVTALVPVEFQSMGFIETETVNALVAMAGLSAHTQRAYRRWITRFLADVNKIDRRSINLADLNIVLSVGSLGPANLKAWLGHLKAKGLGKQSIMQAKASIVWLAQLMG